jgi:hypothetical protein
MTFEECVLYCAKQPELVREFDRLSGTSLGKPRSGLDAMIDEATGKQDDDMAKFVAFVTWAVWAPMAARADAEREEG